MSMKEFLSKYAFCLASGCRGYGQKLNLSKLALKAVTDISKEKDNARRLRVYSRLLVEDETREETVHFSVGKALLST